MYTVHGPFEVVVVILLGQIYAKYIHPHFFFWRNLFCVIVLKKNSKELFDYCMGAEETDIFFLKKMLCPFRIIFRITLV